MAELVQILEKTFSQDPNNQHLALTLLQQAVEENFPEYVKQLAIVLSNTSNAPFIRKSAGLQIKNVLSAREQSSFDKNKMRWLSVPAEIRNYVKECVLQTLGTETLRPSTAAQCIAAIACLEIPINQWPDLINRLNENVNNEVSSSMKREASLEALGYVCQDNQERRLVGPILDSIVTGMKKETNSVYVLLAAIKALSEIVDWAVTNDLDSKVDGIVDVVSTYLQTAELNLYEEAAKCLYKIASRKCVSTRETPIVISLFRDEPMRKILTAANLAAADSSICFERYKYLKALCDLLCALGIHLADVWSYVMKPPPNFPLYLSALSSFFMHPSIYIRAETAQVIATFTGHERISKNEDFLKCIPNLIQFLPKAMNKTCSPITQQNLTSQYSQMDYENEVELNREYVKLREHCLRLIRESAVDHFEQLILVIRNWIMDCCVNSPQMIQADEWDVMKRIITVFLQTSYQLELTTPEIRKEYLGMFDSVLQCSIGVLNLSSPNLLNGVLSILSSLFVLFDNFPDRIPIMLNHLKSILLVENLNNQDIEITAAKRHSIALLLKIVSNFPSAVKPYARIVFDLVAEVSDRVSMMQRANLVHVLAALSNLASTVDEQTEFLYNAVQYDIHYLQQEPFSASPIDFFNQTGLTSNRNILLETSPISPYYQSRLNLKASLTALDGLLNQVIMPSNEASTKIFALFSTIIPKLFNFCKTLNSIYAPECASLIHPSYGLSVLEMAPSERQTIVSSITMIDVENDGVGKKTDEFENVQSNGLSCGDTALVMRKFISEITDLVQNIVGVICSRFSNDFYAMPNASELITDTLYAIEHVPSFRLRLWIRRTWYRIASSCPEQYAQTIMPLMLLLTSHLQKYLVEQWQILKQRQYTDEESEPTEEEMIAESTMSLFSRECALFIVNFIVGEFFSMKNARKELPIMITPISRILMTNQKPFLGIIGLLAKLIACPDSQAAIKCLPAMNVLVYNYRHVIDEQTAIDLLVHGIQSLQMYCNDEMAAGPILILIFNIYAQLRLKYPTMLEVLKQVPTCLAENIENFDKRITSMSDIEYEKLQDKMKRDLMRRVLTSTKLKSPHSRKASVEVNGDGTNGEGVME